MTIENKTLYSVDGFDFKTEEAANHHLLIKESAKMLKTVKRNHKMLLKECKCEYKKFTGKTLRPSGETWEDEYGFEHTKAVGS